MKYVVISQQVFEQYAPTAIDVETDIFNSMEKMFEMAYSHLVNQLLGRSLGLALPDLIEAIDGADDETLGELDEESTKIHPRDMIEIRELVYQYIVNEALHVAIPSLDLVLTNNGFGIVSTQQIAPASKDRVDRLKAACIDARDTAFDGLIQTLPGNSLTKELLFEGRPWYTRTSSLIWTEEDYHMYCMTGSTEEMRHNREVMELNRPKIMMAERSIRQAISTEQWNTTLTALREGETDTTWEEYFDLLYQWFAKLYQVISLGDTSLTPYDEMDEVLAYMDNNKTIFTDYAASDQYTARHTEPYANQPEDGCFFF